MMANTVRCQFHNTRAGKALKAFDPVLYALLETQLADDIAGVVDGLVTEERPSLEKIMAMTANTVGCRFHNTTAGQTLKAFDPVLYASLETQVAGNIAGVVDGLVTEITGIES